MLHNRSPSWLPIFHLPSLRCASQKSIWNLNLSPLPNSTTLVNQQLSILLLTISYVHLNLNPYLAALTQTTAISHLDFSQEPLNDLSCLVLPLKSFWKLCRNGIFICIYNYIAYKFQHDGPWLCPLHISLTFILQPHWILFTSSTQTSPFSSSLAISYSSFKHQLMHHILGEIFSEPLCWITYLTIILPLLFSHPCQIKCPSKSRIFLLCLLLKC